MMYWFSEYAAESEKKKLCRCPCGELFTLGASSDVKRRHLGHGMFKFAIKLSFWEWFKAKKGWIK